MGERLEIQHALDRRVVLVPGKDHLWIPATMLAAFEQEMRRSRQDRLDVFLGKGVAFLFGIGVAIDRRTRFV